VILAKKDLHKNECGSIVAKPYIYIYIHTHTQLQKNNIVSVSLVEDNQVNVFGVHKFDCQWVYFYK